jgi:sirohydrochlorin cobaltochelatase
LAKLKKVTHHVLVCAHKHCLKQGGREAGRELKRALKELPPGRRAMLTAVDCLDQCDDGPVVVVYPEGVWYGAVDAVAAREIAEQHVGRGRVVERKVLHVLPGGPSEIDEGV